MHYFERAFLERMAEQLVKDGRFHIAHKKIPSKDGPVQVAAPHQPLEISARKSLGAGQCL